MPQSDFFVRFWGVRGSTPVPGPSTLKFGGNTSCVEIRCGKHVLIIDAGSGIRTLGDSLLKEGVDTVDILFSHSHFDHIAGLPFFSMLYDKKYKVDIWSAHLAPDISTKEMVTNIIKSPYFPVSTDYFSSNVIYHDFTIGDTLTPKSDISVKTGRLNHPDGCVGYRVEWQGKSICYISDTEHFEDGADKNILELIKGADIMIYDTTFTDEEYDKFKGYGHSTWQEGIRLCKLADVKQFVLFHHHPKHDDEIMAAIEDEARQILPNTVAAREGMILRP